MLTLFSTLGFLNIINNKNSLLYKKTSKNNKNNKINKNNKNNKINK
jgi:hypothetical protein